MVTNIRIATTFFFCYGNTFVVLKKKVKKYRPRWFQEAEAPTIQDNREMQVVRLLALRTGHLYPQEVFLALTSVRR